MTSRNYLSGDDSNKSSSTGYSCSSGACFDGGSYLDMPEDTVQSSSTPEAASKARTIESSSGTKSCQASEQSWHSICDSQSTYVQQTFWAPDAGRRELSDSVCYHQSP